MWRRTIKPMYLNTLTHTRLHNFDVQYGSDRTRLRCDSLIRIAQHFEQDIAAPVDALLAP